MDEMTRSTHGRRRRSPTTSFVLANVFLSTLILFSCSTTTGTTTPTPTPTPTPTQNPGEVVAPTSHRMLSSGKIVGTSGRYGGLVWRGIPYARPPVGERRFRAPNPASSWEGTREALRFGSPCPQYASETNAGEVYSNGDIVGSEDCLFLNVYAPTEASPSKDSTGGLLPVLFWIHGGGNTSGTASFYDGSRLAQEHQVLVVTINYRLGFLGWFRHRALRAGADAIDGSGNFGTLDQILALDWVQSNIDAFGGDPTNVTIFGESAGAWNVISLMASPLAAGKFHRAIAQSPVTWSFSAAAAENYVDDAQPGRPSSSNEAIVRMMIAGGHAADRDGAKAEVAAMDDASLSRFLRAKSVVELFAIQDLIEPL